MALRDRTRSTRFLVAALVTASLLTITVDYRQQDSGPLAALGRLALSVVTPLQEGVSKAFRPVGAFFSALARLPSLRAENDRLVAENERLLGELAQTTSVRRQLEELRRALDLAESLRFETVGATVVASGVSNFEWTITIDKGSSDGVRPDMAVVTGAGLVGSVVETTFGSAVVRLIIDPDSAVAARLASSGETGLLVGQRDADLRMELVDPSTQVQPGEPVETAGYRLPGLRGLYPPGIPIGVVSRAQEDPSVLEKFVLVRPSVDFSTLDVVLVVLRPHSG